MPVNCQLLREKGVQLAQTFGIKNLSINQGCIEKLKNWHGLAMCITSSESTRINDANVEQWLTLLKDYKLCD